MNGSSERKRVVMPRPITMAIFIIALITLIVVAFTVLVLPILPSSLSVGILVVCAIVIAVTSFLGALKDVVELFWPSEKKESSSYTHDREVYERIVGMFHEGRLLEPFVGFPFHSPFDNNFPYQIGIITEALSKPRFAFWDEEIEALKQDLYTTLDQLTDEMGEHTYPLDGTLQTAIPDMYRGKGRPLPKNIEANIRKL